MKGFVHIETINEVRRRHRYEMLELDRNFWQKNAEQLQDLLDQIFDESQSYGSVKIIQHGKTITLRLEPPESAQPPLAVIGEQGETR